MAVLSQTQGEANFGECFVEIIVFFIGNILRVPQPNRFYLIHQYPIPRGLLYLCTKWTASNTHPLPTLEPFLFLVFRLFLLQLQFPRLLLHQYLVSLRASLILHLPIIHCINKMKDTVNLN